MTIMVKVVVLVLVAFKTDGTHEIKTLEVDSFMDCASIAESVNEKAPDELASGFIALRASCAEWNIFLLGRNA